MPMFCCTRQGFPLDTDQVNTETGTLRFTAPIPPYTNDMVICMGIYSSGAPMRGVEHVRPEGIGEERSGPGVKSLRATNRWTCGSENRPSPPTSFPVPAGWEPLMTRRPLSTNTGGSMGHRGCGSATP